MTRPTSKNTPTARAPRGRPAHTAEQVADMRAHIAARALELFTQEGYAAISMRRLAVEAGCTPMTLYKYFDNKFAILRTLWADVLRVLFVELERVAAAHHGARRLEAVALAYVEFWLAHREHYFLLFMSGGITQDDVSAFMGEGALLARFELFRECIRGATDACIPDEALRVRGEVLVCGLNGVAQALVTMSGYPWASPDALVRGVVAGVLAAE